jgi:hypothetical protein
MGLFIESMKSVYTWAMQVETGRDKNVFDRIPGQLLRMCEPAR